MSNLEAAERVIAALDLLGRVEEVDAARVEHVRTLARAVDEKPHSPGLHQEYRAAYEGLMADDSDDGIPDGVPSWLSTSVRDP